MIDVLSTVGPEHECMPTETYISGKTFTNFLRPLVETTMGIGKADPSVIDPLLIISPQGLICIAKTVRVKGDGESAVYYLSKNITSDRTSYICMDFNKAFLDFCRSVRKDDYVTIKFGRDFEFFNFKQAKIEQEKKGYLTRRSLYKASSNSLSDIQKEIDFAMGLLASTPKKWTGKLTVPSGEVKKFYNNVWKYQHRALFYHVIQDDNASVIAYSEDSLREMFEPSPFGLVAPKRRFFMARHFVKGEDGVRCEGHGAGVFRANFRILSDIADSNLPFEFSFGDDLGTYYGLTVKDKNQCLRIICENAISDDALIKKDLNDTLGGLISLDPIKTLGFYEQSQIVPNN